MRILLVHNYYQHAGGEGLVFQAESELLKRHDHAVVHYTAHNEQITPANPVTTATRMLWNRRAYEEVQQLIRQENIDVVHCHNTFPLISPSVYRAAKESGAAVVQTLHNYRLLCPNALFLRNERPCEDCLGKTFPWPGIVHKCYRNSMVDSGGVAAYLAFHRLTHTWTNAVDAYIALTDFAKEKFVQGGIPEHKIHIKPNFIDPDPGYQPSANRHALFVGRLSKEKGIDTLLSAWSEIGQAMPLRIIGDGPKSPEVAAVAQANPAVKWLGRCESEEVYRQMKAAAFLVFPSHWYEGLPRTIIESLSAGTPVVTSDLGSMSSLIKHQYSGWHFQARSASSLVQVVRNLLAAPQALQAARQNARQEYEDNYSAAENYLQLISIYSKARRNRASEASSLSIKSVTPNEVLNAASKQDSFH